MGILGPFGIHLTMYGITLFRLAPRAGRGEPADGRVTDLGRAVRKLLRMRPDQFRRISPDPEHSAQARNRLTHRTIRSAIACLG